MTETDKVEISQLSNLISSDFTKNGLEIVKPDDLNNLNELRNFLTEKISEMLDKKFDLLINTLYLIDVNEEKVNELFAADNRDFIPSALAGLVIERQLQKLNYRRMYREGRI